MQHILFGNAGENTLFPVKTLRRYLDEKRRSLGPPHFQSLKIVREWVQALSTSNASESSLEQKFVQDVFVRALGYNVYPSTAGAPASLYGKPPSRITCIRKTPDAILGRFGDLLDEVVAVVELKTPGTRMDLPQKGSGTLSPIQQAFEYGNTILGVRWVIVSDMRTIRLYSVESSASFSKIDLRECADREGNPTDEFLKLMFLMSHEALVAGGKNSSVSKLHIKSAAHQLQVKDGFYGAYYDIRNDLLVALQSTTASWTPPPSAELLLEAAQRLLDRMLFIYYCEDHPDQLIAQETVRKQTTAAWEMPGASECKVYSVLKHLFREIDVGSPKNSRLRLPSFNGELFKPHPIIDQVDLPDSLHEKRYRAADPDGDDRVIQGAWGLHVYDFWSELNEHLLGHIFEESLSDFKLHTGTDKPTAADKLRERKAHGVYFTTRLLSDFLCSSALQSVLDESIAPSDRDSIGERDLFQRTLERLLQIRVLDPACGSGAFLVSAYEQILSNFWHLQESIEALDAALKSGQRDLLAFRERTENATLLRSALFGFDLLPQAVEIAKLALWLRSARKGEKIADLGNNLRADDTLRAFAAGALSQEGLFDLVVGNPPWGSEIEPQVRRDVAERLKVDPDRKWDAWELFVMVAIQLLRDGGRLAMVLPDSLLYSDKIHVRRVLLESTTIEKLHSLGSDWFGADVRMGTVVIQARKGAPELTENARAVVLAGDLRRRAIKGEVPLRQIEAQKGRWIPLARSYEDFSIDVFRDGADDIIIEKMTSRSLPLSDLCGRARGEEINKRGTLWECPSCLKRVTPAAKAKGGGFQDKSCPTCGMLLNSMSARQIEMISSQSHEPNTEPYIDGDEILHRYQRIKARKWIRMDFADWVYKPAAIYASPKIMIRQAGVGISATIDKTSARCPQSIYLYHLNDEAARAGYSLELVLAVLCSRTIAYYVFKRHGEIDPSKAHAKLTHARLEQIPVPNIDSDEARLIQTRIVTNVQRLLATAQLGGKEDLEIEQDLRALWGVTAKDGAYINGELAELPDSQNLRDLLPQTRSAGTDNT